MARKVQPTRDLKVPMRVFGFVVVTLHAKHTSYVCLPPYTEGRLGRVESNGRVRCEQL